MKFTYTVSQKTRACILWPITFTNIDHYQCHLIELFMYLVCLAIKVGFWWGHFGVVNCLPGSRLRNSRECLFALFRCPADCGGVLHAEWYCSEGRDPGHWSLPTSQSAGYWRRLDGIVAWRQGPTTLRVVLCLSGPPGLEVNHVMPVLSDIIAFLNVSSHVRDIYVARCTPILVWSF